MATSYLASYVYLGSDGEIDVDVYEAKSEDDAIAWAILTKELFPELTPGECLAVVATAVTLPEDIDTREVLRAFMETGNIPEDLLIRSIYRYDSTEVRKE